MKFIERIKRVFKPKKEEIKENTTTISLYDVSDVNVPSFNELSKEQYNLFLKYKQQIDINNIESVIKYNQEISKNGEKLSNLLIKILYELNEILRKDDKTEQELQEIDINNSIKNMEIIVIRELLYNLKNDCILRTLAVQSKRKDIESKNPQFIEIFSHAAKIKRNMQLRSLIEAENRCKITIKTLEQQINAVGNAINNNDVYIDKMNIYNKLINKIQKDNTRKIIYVNKLEYLIDITKQLNCHFSKLSEISNLLKHNLNEDIEQQILENFAITELELDRFIIKNKDKMVQEYINKIKELKDITITHENKDKLLKEAEYFQIINEVFNEYIDEYKEDLYKIKFNILTFDINNQRETYSKFKMYLSRYDYRNEMEHYIKIISNEINNINRGISLVANILKKQGKLKNMIKLLNPHFKSFDGKYQYEDILFDREKLALLLAFQSEEHFDNFFEENKYVINDPEVINCIILPYCNFEWYNLLPLKTIYILYELDGKEKPKFYDIYKLSKNNYLHTILLEFEYEDFCFPEGIEIINCNITPTLENDKLIYYIRLLSGAYLGKVAFPSTLKRISGDVFGDTEIRNVELNDGLEYIGNDVFLKQYLEKITFPQSVNDIDQNSFDFSSIKELEFKNYKESKLLYNLLYENTRKYDFIILRLFEIVYLDDAPLYIKYIIPKINKIILSNKDEIIELTYPEMYNAINKNLGGTLVSLDKLRCCLSNLIEQKSGINLKEYHEQEYNKNK